MKKKWLGIRVLFSLCAALGWWGLLYPELSLTPDTVVLKIKDDSGNLREQPFVWDFDGSIYWDLLNAGPSRITFRSKLLTDFSALWEAINGDK